MDKYDFSVGSKWVAKEKPRIIPRKYNYSVQYVMVTDDVLTPRGLKTITVQPSAYRYEDFTLPSILEEHYYYYGHKDVYALRNKETGKFYKSTKRTKKVIVYDEFDKAKVFLTPGELKDHWLNLIGYYDTHYNRSPSGQIFPKVVDFPKELELVKFECSNKQEFDEKLLLPTNIDIQLWADTVFIKRELVRQTSPIVRTLYNRMEKKNEILPYMMFTKKLPGKKSRKNTYELAGTLVKIRSNIEASIKEQNLKIAKVGSDPSGVAAAFESLEDLIMIRMMMEGTPGFSLSYVDFTKPIPEIVDDLKEKRA